MPLRAILLVLAVAAMQQAVSAQNITGAILGNVTDASRAAVGQAAVELTNSDTTQSVRVETEPSGLYQALHLDRNPVWLSGGTEVDSPKGRIISWSQPELALYDDDPTIRMSYPDFVEEGGKCFLTETQKDMARVHEIEPTLLAGLWNQFEATGVARKGLALELKTPIPAVAKAPVTLPFYQRSHRADNGKEDLNAGFSLDLWVRFDALKPDQRLVDTRTADGRCYALRTTGDRSLEIILSDGRTENRWASDPDSLAVNRRQHIVVTVDGGPRIITFVIDGVLTDGGNTRQFGWGRFSPNLKTAAGAPHRQSIPGLPSF